MVLMMKRSVFIWWNKIWRRRIMKVLKKFTLIELLIVIAIIAVLA